MQFHSFEIDTETGFLKIQHEYLEFQIDVSLFFYLVYHHLHVTDGDKNKVATKHLILFDSLPHQLSIKSLPERKIEKIVSTTVHNIAYVNNNNIVHSLSFEFALLVLAFDIV